MTGMEQEAEIERLTAVAIGAMSKGADAKGLAALTLFQGVLKLRAEAPDALAELERRLEGAGTSFLEICVELRMSSLGYFPLALVRQHAVGHGGFHTGALGHETPSLIWVYDCGSLRKAGKKQLEEELATFAARVKKGRGKIDFLFVSHFDSDHISGLTDLLDVVKVDTVVLPYLDDTDRLAVQLAAVVDGALTPDLMNVLRDPTAWFLDQGAQRVVQIQQDRGDAPPGLLRPEVGTGLRDLPGGPSLLDPKNVPIPADQSITAPSGSGWLAGPISDWAFIPFVNPARPEAKQKLRRRVAELVQESVDNPQLADIVLGKALADSEFVDDLKDAYKASGLSDANAVSLSLYAGPVDRPAASYRSSILLRSNNGRFGWLLTGDAKLRYTRRRRRLLEFYEGALRRVAFMMLPHHGSQDNFHEDLISDIDTDVLLFACREVKDGDEPLHEDVWQYVKSRKHRIVTSDQGTMLTDLSGPNNISDTFALQDMVNKWI
jgi:beta-lactamase superfamily II metal-dependent hydrolase